MAKKNLLTHGKKAKAERWALANRLEEAEPLYASVCKSDPMDIESWVKLAVIQSRLGRFNEAESSVRRALRLAPSLSFARHTLATILQRQGKADEASTLLEEALALHPDSAEDLINLARLREKQGRGKDAFALYHRALALLPESPYLLAKAGELLEREGRLMEANAAIARGLRTNPDQPELNLVAARLERHAGRHAEAAKRLEAMLGYPLSTDTGTKLHILLGQLHDQLGNTGQALSHLLTGKRRSALANDPDGQGRSRFLAWVDQAHDGANADLTAFFQADPIQPAESPIFLIGFPRSGTTLIERVLDSHPALQAMEEKPAAAIMEQAFLRMSSGVLANLTQAQIGELRQVYLDSVANHLERRTGCQLVDKHPLHTIRVPLLLRVFPQAKFILAIRHPCDVILSVMMQNIGANQALPEIASLQDAAEIYARFMGAWREYAERLPLRWQRIRYEDLITNFEPEVRTLLDFLEVGWDASVLDHTRHAENHALTGTPNYPQVTQPIYQHARYRWMRYAKEFEPVMETLRPFIEYFGYSE